MKQMRFVSAAIAILVMSGLVVLAEDVKPDAKPDVTGSWTWSFQGRNGNTMTSTLTLKQDGDKITGSMSGRGKPTDISDAKLSGDDLTFKVTRTRNDGSTMTIDYEGKVTADEIKGKSTSNFNGNPMSRDWDAKRGDASTTQPATQPAS
jgi:hypothetical protein